jgi:signal peptidase I
MNLALILTVLTLFAGAVVVVDRLFWRRASEEGGESRGRDTLVEYSRSFFPVLLFVLVIRSFVFEPFRIPSGSMMPTLLQGDFIFVEKFSYGLRLPVTETKVLDIGEPERGDVVVFRLPSDPSINYIKRVVGLPGDEVVYERHRLTINGEPVALEADPAATAMDPRFIEQLGDHRHDILINIPNNIRKDGTFHVPDGHYFVMGDNRDNSQDSRYIGFVPEANLVGKAVRIWMNIDGFSWPRWERIGEKIQ